VHSYFLLTDYLLISFQITLRFRFPISAGHWYLTSVEVEKDTTKFDLTVVGKSPSAPIGFSYKCSRTLEFRHNSTVLILYGLQVRSKNNQYLAKLYFFLIRSQGSTITWWENQIWRCFQLHWIHHSSHLGWCFYHINFLDYLNIWHYRNIEH
jgi:hypothetical protein